MIHEESFFDLRFRPDDPCWTLICQADPRPASKPNGNVVSWAVERKDGGRGFATTCGHFYDNWKHEAFRKTLLNALAWTAGLSVPERGVASPFFDRESIAEHLDQPELLGSQVESADDTE
jgi:hypothetical protein